jgi:hypothetical protein
MPREVVAQRDADAEHSEQPLAEAFVPPQGCEQLVAISRGLEEPGQAGEGGVRVGGLAEGGQKISVRVQPEDAKCLVSRPRVGEAAAREPQRLRPSQLRPRHTEQSLGCRSVTCVAADKTRL